MWVAGDSFLNSLRRCVSAQFLYLFSSASSSIHSLRSVIDLRRAGSPLVYRYDPDLSRFDQVVGILLNDLNCSVTRSMAFRIWEARKCVTGGSGAQARRYCCGEESAWRHACSGCSRGCAMACPAPVSSTVSRRSGARAGAEASQHPPGDGRCCQRVRFGLYYRNLLASLLLPFYVPRQHWPCRRGEGGEENY